MIITNEKYTEFCKKQQSIEDKITEVACDLKELKDGFAEQRRDFAKYRSDTGDLVCRMTAKMDDRCDGICNLIGEVPRDKTVMQCIRDNEKQISRFSYGVLLVIGVIQILANYPKISSLFIN